MQFTYRTLMTRDTLKRSLVFALFVALSFYTLVQLSAPGEPAFASGTITDTVFQDFNGDGTLNTTVATGVSKDLHVAGVTVTAYDSSGMVLRCPACEQVMVRVVRTRDTMYLDARGAVYLKIQR